MSCYEWEKGSFVIPATQWASFKKAIRDNYNKAVERDLSILTQLAEAAKEEGKGRRNMTGRDWLNLIDDVYYKKFNTQDRQLSVTDEFYLSSMLISKETGKLITPKKSSMPFANTATKSFGFEDLTVSFDDENRKLHWHVSDNNHAVDRAHQCFLGRCVMRALGQVTWTRGSGGYLVGNNEHNQDNSDYGGGSNYLTVCFGPMGEQAQARERGAAAPRRTRSSRPRG